MLRRLWKLVAFVTVAVGYTLYAGVAVRLKRSSRERAQAMARHQQRGARLLLRILGVRVRVKGRPLEHRAGAPPTLLVSNHLGLLDPFVLASQVQAALVGKAEIDDWPAAGWVARTMGVLFVERGHSGAVKGFVERVQERLRDGVSVLAFPEGTTNERSQVLPFKTGVFSGVAGQKGEVVLPLYLHVRSIDGRPARVGEERRRVIWAGGTEPGLAHAWRLLALRRVVMEVRVGEPIDAGEHGRRALARRAQRQVEAMAEGALGG
jgi:1-acyl-sn-glycerol-3-phosphate acyltransferase